MHCAKKLLVRSLIGSMIAFVGMSAHAVPLEKAKNVVPVKKATHTPSFPHSNWYIDVSGGVTSQSDSDVSNSATSSEFSYDKGFSFSAALGYRPEAKHSALGYMRFEAALGYQQAELDSDGVLPAAGVTGDLSTYSLMLNSYYDFRNATGFVPYIGAGLGVARVSLKDATRVNVSDDSSILPAYQLLTGFSIEPKSLPYTTLHLGYRYFNTLGDAEFLDSTGANIEVEQASHNFEGGVRWHF